MLIIPNLCYGQIMRKTKPKKPGKIIPNGVKSDPHELGTFWFFAELGKDVELIPASHTPENKRPDCIVDGLEWEVKCPMKSNRSALERTFYRASQQSSNIVIDLRNLCGDSQDVIDILEHCFKSTRKVRRMQIITKSEELKVYIKA